MSKFINIIMVVTLAITTSCANQDGKTAQAGVDEQLVIVNKISERTNDQGETQSFGEIGILVGSTKNADLESATDNNQIKMLSEDEMRANGIFFEPAEQSELAHSDLQKAWFWWAVAGLIVLGLVADNNYYRGYRDGARVSWGYSYSNYYYYW